MKKFWELNKSKIVLIAIVLLGAFFRLYNLNWDQGHYLHPDERLYVNASGISLPKTITDFFSPQSPLNPNMFYYGSFPLYLYKIINVIFLSSMDFTIASRLVSSIFSILTIPIVFLIGKNIFSRKIGIFSALIFAFSAGSIQHAHFNTTESILTFLLSLIVLCGIHMLKQRKYILACLLGILTGAAYATKITGLTFSLIPLMSFVFIYLKERRISKLAILLTIFFVTTILFGFLFAPYQIIDYQQFSSEQTYMQGVTYGKDKPPFIIIYEKTLPHIYPLLRILPFTFGFISFLLSLIGLYLILKLFFKKGPNRYFYSLIIFYPIFYFLWAGMWYAKFSRYYILLFPFLSLWAAYFLSKLKNIYIIILLLLIAVNGTLFMKIYLMQNTRIQASEWIYSYIPSQSKIAGEHWDDNLPLPIMQSSNKQYKMSELTVYDQDSQEKILKLSNDLSRNDYFIISSRRVYYSILRNKEKYPLTENFYKLLFEEKLGFRLEKSFTNYPYYFSDDFADETFQSYDHPPVYIFKNVKNLYPDTIYKLINENT